MKVTHAKIGRLFWIMFWPNLITQVLQSRNVSLAEVREMRQKRESEISSLRRLECSVAGFDMYGATCKGWREDRPWLTAGKEMGTCILSLKGPQLSQ